MSAASTRGEGIALKLANIAEASFVWPIDDSLARDDIYMASRPEIAEYRRSLDGIEATLLRIRRSRSK